MTTAASTTTTAASTTTSASPTIEPEESALQSGEGQARDAVASTTDGSAPQARAVLSIDDAGAGAGASDWAESEAKAIEEAAKTLEEAKAELSKAKTKLKKAKTKLEKAKDELAAGRGEPAARGERENDEMNTARSDLKKKTAEWEAAKKNLEKLEEGKNGDEAAKAKLITAEWNVQLLASEVGRLEAEVRLAAEKVGRLQEKVGRLQEKVGRLEVILRDLQLHAVNMIFNAQIGFARLVEDRVDSSSKTASSLRSKAAEIASVVGSSASVWTVDTVACKQDEAAITRIANLVLGTQYDQSGSNVVATQASKTASTHTSVRGKGATARASAGVVAPSTGSESSTVAASEASASVAASSTATGVVTISEALSLHQKRTATSDGKASDGTTSEEKTIEVTTRGVKASKTKKIEAKESEVTESTGAKEEKVKESEKQCEVTIVHPLANKILTTILRALDALVSDASANGMRLYVESIGGLASEPNVFTSSEQCVRYPDALLIGGVSKKVTKLTKLVQQKAVMAFEWKLDLGGDGTGGSLLTAINEVLRDACITFRSGLKLKHRVFYAVVGDLVHWRFLKIWISASRDTPIVYAMSPPLKLQTKMHVIVRYFAHIVDGINDANAHMTKSYIGDVDRFTFYAGSVRIRLVEPLGHTSRSTVFKCRVEDKIDDCAIKFFHTNEERKKYTRRVEDELSGAERVFRVANTCQLVDIRGATAVRDQLCAVLYRDVGVPLVSVMERIRLLDSDAAEEVIKNLRYVVAASLMKALEGLRTKELAIVDLHEDNVVCELEDPHNGTTIKRAFFIDFESLTKFGEEIQATTAVHGCLRINKAEKVDENLDQRLLRELLDRITSQSKDA